MRIRSFECLEQRVLLTCNAAGDVPRVPHDNACRLSPQTPMVGRFEQAGDSDVFAFDAASSEVVTFEVASAIEAKGLRLEVLSPTAEILHTELGNQARWEAPHAERYYFRVSSALQDGTYRIDVSSRIDYPDEVLADSPLLQLGTPVAASIDTPGDYDVFAVSVETGDRLLVRTATERPSFQPEISLLSGSVSHQTVPKVGTNELSYLLPKSGVYWLRVESSAIGDYTLLAETVGDDYTSEPTVTTPLLVLNEPLAAEFEYRADVDAFSFQAIAGQEYIVSADSGSMSIRSPNGETSQAPTFVADVTGVYTITLSANRRDHYDVEVSLPKRDEYPDTIPDVNASITPNTAIQGALQYAGDVDLIRLAGEMGQMVRLQGSSSGSVRLLDASGDAIREFPLRDGFSWRIAEESGYYLEIGEQPPWPYNIDYLVVEDDHPDVPSLNAQVVYLNQPFTGEMEVSGDVDLFAIDLIAGQTIGIVTPWKLRGSTTRLLNAEGQHLVANRAPTSGRFYISISDVKSPSYSATVKVLHLNDHDDEPSDFVETFLIGDTLNLQANRAPTGELIREDADVLAFDAVAGQLVRFAAEHTGQGRVSLRFPTLDGSLPDVSRRHDHSMWKAQTSGRYFVKAIARGFSGPYDIRTSVVGMDHHGDSPNSATQLDVDTTMEGQVQDGVDYVDFFSLVPVNSPFIQVELTTEAPRDLDWDIVTADQVLVPPAGYGDGSLWHADGSLFLRVRSRRNDPVQYSVRFREANDPGDEPNRVDAVTEFRPFDTVIEGQRDHNSDFDVFGFDGVPNQLYQVTTEAIGDPPTLAGFDQDENTLRFIRPGVDGVSVLEAPADGKLFVSVYARTDTYRLKVSPISLAGQLSVGNNSLPLPQQTGVYQITAGAGQYMQLEFGVPPGSAGHDIKLGASKMRIDEGKYDYYIPDDGRLYLWLVNLDPDQPVTEGDAVQVTLTVTDDDHASTPGTAELMPLDRPVTGILRDSREVDYFRIDVEQGDGVQIRMSGGPNGYAPYFSLVTEDQQRLAVPRNMLLQWRATHSGSVYLKVEGAKTSYQADLKLTRDEFADSVEEALLAPENGVMRGQISDPTDKDVVLFDAVAGQVGSIVAEDYPNWPNGVSVRDPQGTWSHLSVEGNTAYWKADQDGRYSLMLAPGIIGSYHLRLRLGSDDVPDHAAGAVLVAESTEAINGRLETRRDIDYFAIEKLAGEKLQIAMESSSDRRILHVESPDGLRLATQVNNFMLLPSMQGTYRFFAYDNSILNRVESYQFRISSVDDDHPDTVETAQTTIVPGQPQMGVIEAAGDTDTFVLIAEPNTIYRFSGAAVAVYSATGEYQGGRNTGEFTDWKSEAGGDYVLQVDGDVLGNYTIQTVAIADDAADRDGPLVRNLAAGQTEAGSFEIEADVDTWETQLVAGGVYQVSIRHAEEDRTPWYPDKETRLSLRTRRDGWFEATRSGLHRFRVSAGGRVGEYTVTLLTPGEGEDIDQIPGLISQNVPVVDVGASVHGKFEYSRDVDVYAIDVGANERLEISSPQLVNRYALEMELMDQWGNVLGSAGGVAPKQIMYWTSHVSQRVFLRVTQRASSTTDYTIDIGRDGRPVISVDGRRNVPVSATAESRGALLELQVESPGTYNVTLNPSALAQFVLYSPDMRYIQNLAKNTTWNPARPGTYYVAVAFAAAPRTDTVRISQSPQETWPQASEWTPTIQLGEPVTPGPTDELGFGRYGFEARQGDVLQIIAPDSHTAILTSDLVLVPSRLVAGNRFWEIPRDGRYYLELKGTETVTVERVDQEGWRFPMVDDSGLRRIDFESLQPLDSQATAVSLHPFSAEVAERFRFNSKAGSQLSVLDRHGFALATGKHSVGWVAEAEGEYYLQVRRDFVGEDQIAAHSQLRSPTDINGDGVFSSVDLDELLSNVHVQSSESDSDINADGRVDRSDADAYFSDFALLAGDANLDRKVDFADFLALSVDFGRSAGSNWERGDFNGDGETSFADFLLLASNYGRTTASMT